VKINKVFYPGEQRRDGVVNVLLNGHEIILVDSSFLFVFLLDQKLPFEKDKL